MSDTKEVIKEALDNIVDKRLTEMKDNLNDVLAAKVDFILEEKKKEIAARIFSN